MTRLFTLAFLLVTAGCAAPSTAPRSVAVAPASQSAPNAAPLSPELSAPAPERTTDHCGAASLQYLVGRPKTDIPIPVSPNSRRVLCTTCPMTRDYREDRQTILFDSATGLITVVACN